MENFGFIKVAAAVPSVRVADCRHNADCIAKLLREACTGGVQITVFPELSLTAYSCGDLFQNALERRVGSRLYVARLEGTASAWHDWRFQPLVLRRCVGGKGS